LNIRSDLLLQRRSFLTGGISVGTTGLLSACTWSPDLDHTDAEAPQSIPLKKPVRTAWVFSSGGPRGFAHVGVIKALSELGHTPDLLVGASVGAVVAVAFASGKPVRDIEQLALDLHPLSIGRFALSGPERFSGSAIASMVRHELNATLLEQLKTQVICVAARRSDSQLVGFNAGDAGIAVQASCAIEGQFSPVRIRGEQFVDPDLYQPLPVRLALQLGATRILAIDASAFEDKAPSGTERYRAGDLRKRALTEPDARAATLTIHPEFGYYVNLSREFRERAIAAGYQATLASAPQLAALHRTS
jgi:NTE family protein